MCNSDAHVSAYAVEYDGDREYLCPWCARQKGITHAAILDSDNNSYDSEGDNEFIPGAFEVRPVYCWDGEEADYERFCTECKDNLELPLTEEGRLEKIKTKCTPEVNELRDDKGQLPAYAWPGGYPIMYFDTDMSVICPKCANLLDWNDAGITAFQLHMEGPAETCENCYTQIDSAYGDPDEEAKEAV